MRQWALMRWEEGTDVGLATALPDIKTEIRFERETTKNKITIEHAVFR